MVRIYFGAPGCGKSTLIAYFVQRIRKKALKKALKHKKFQYHYIFCNALVQDTNQFKVEQLDRFAFPAGSAVFVDEAGIDLNSRQTLSLPMGTIEYLKLHRHWLGTDLSFFSQSWDDIDITVKRLCVEVWHLKKLGPFTLVRRVLKDSDVNDETKKIEDVFKKQRLIKKFLPPPFGSFSFFIIYRPKYYKYFDSFSTPDRPYIKGIPITKDGATV